MQRLNDLVVVGRTDVTHVVAVDEVDRAALAVGDHLVRVRPRLVGQQDHAAGSEVDVAVVECLVVVRSEVVADVPPLGLSLSSVSP